MLRRLAPALLLVAARRPGAAAMRIPPPPDQRVNDYAGALDPADRDRLEQLLAARETTSRNQVVVAIFRSLEGESLEDYSIRLAKAWRIGQKGLDNGVIFLVFLDDRKMRIEVGYGLEGGADRRDRVLHPPRRRRPALPRGPDADGIAAGLDAIDRAIARDVRSARPARAARPPTLAAARASWAALRHPRGDRASCRTGGSRRAAAPRVDRRVVRLGRSLHRRDGGLGGGMGGGGSSGGGFSGGGGSFGGGGSSGSW